MGVPFKRTDLPEADRLEYKADLYRKMADALRSDAAKLRFFDKHPEYLKRQRATEAVAPAE